MFRYCSYNSHILHPVRAIAHQCINRLVWKFEMVFNLFSVVPDAVYLASSPQWKTNHTYSELWEWHLVVWFLFTCCSSSQVGLLLVLHQKLPNLNLSRLITPSGLYHIIHRIEEDVKNDAIIGTSIGKIMFNGSTVIMCLCVCDVGSNWNVFWFKN